MCACVCVCGCACKHTLCDQICCLRQKNNETSYKVTTLYLFNKFEVLVLVFDSFKSNLFYFDLSDLIKKFL